MICDCLWLGCVFLACFQTMLNVFYVYVIVTYRDVARLWIGCVLYRMSLDLCNVY